MIIVLFAILLLFGICKISYERENAYFLVIKLLIKERV